MAAIVMYMVAFMQWVGSLVCITHLEIAAIRKALAPAVACNPVTLSVVVSYL
jgi:hypothetical protein